MLVNEQSISGKIDAEKELSGNLSIISDAIKGGIIDPNTLDSTAIHYGTKSNWDSQRSIITQKGHLYIYSDAGKKNLPNGTTLDIPAMKIGDGTSYLIDMPYSLYGSDHERLVEHILDNSIHVSKNDRTNWNDKVKIAVNESAEALVITS